MPFAVDCIEDVNIAILSSTRLNLLKASECRGSGIVSNGVGEGPGLPVTAGASMLLSIDGLGRALSAAALLPFTAETTTSMPV